MQFKNNTKQRSPTIQGLRSFKDTLPKNIKKIINKRGVIYSEILNNWKYIVGEKLFKVCFPKSYKNSNKFMMSTLLIMVRRGHEIDLEYSKQEIINRVNVFFGNSVIEKIKFSSFTEDKQSLERKDYVNLNATDDRFNKKIKDVKNEKIKKSLMELTKAFKKK